MGFMNMLLMVLMVAVAIALVVGLAVMIRGGATNEKYGNKLMMWRVGLQAAALAVLGVLFLISKGGGQ